METREREKYSFFVGRADVFEVRRIANSIGLDLAVKYGFYDSVEFFPSDERKGEHARLSTSPITDEAIGRLIGKIPPNTLLPSNIPRSL